MSKSQSAEDNFLSNTVDHQMTVISDHGGNRHIRFRRPDTSTYGFDLITWPGHLCITGDRGTYVFRRVEDMFEFFRAGPSEDAYHSEKALLINPEYWGEKLLSIGTNAGYREFDWDRFKERITEGFDQWKEDEEPTKEQADELWKEIEENVLSTEFDGELFSYHATYEFSHKGFQFEAFFDGSFALTERYTDNYLWCLYAIVWGIGKYDAARSPQEAENEGK